MWLGAQIFKQLNTLNLYLVCLLQKSISKAAIGDRGRNEVKQAGGDPRFKGIANEGREVSED